MFVAGEAAGIGGADLAQVEGELAGCDGRRARAALGRRQRAPAAGRRRPTCPRCARAREARGLRAASSSDLFDPRPGLLGLATPDTVLCRCEDVTAGAVDDAVADGATTMAALKIVTRCGQGPCQGRVCERLVCERLPEPERFSARAPIRPIPLGVLMEVE